MILDLEPLPGGIPSDCDYCPPGEIALLEAVAAFEGRAICLTCIARKTRET